MERKKPFYECIQGFWGSVEMHLAEKDGKRYLVCECSGKKECRGCQFNFPELADQAFGTGGIE